MNSRASGTVRGMEPLLPMTAERPDAVAVIHDDRTRTWAELEREARRVARALAGVGLREGDRWALLSHNRLEWAELFLGNVLAGTRYVPLNWHLTTQELEYLLANSGATFLVVDEANEERGRVAAANCGLAADRVVVIDRDLPGWLAAHTPDGTDAPLTTTVAGAPLLYTGGTTGASKGVVRPDQGAPVRQWVKGVAAWGGFIHMPAEGTMLVTTPLYHAFGAGVLGAALARRHTVVLRDRFEVDRFLDDVEEYAVTSAPLVPTLMVRLAKLVDSDWTSRDLASLRWITHTAAPCPGWAKQALIDRLGPIVVEFYGSSEGTGPVVCTSDEWMARPGTVGRPNPMLEVSVVGDDGDDLPPGEIGTLYFRRADGAPTYHGDDEKTQASRLADGRFTVGDLGYVDEDGFMYLVDRRVDLIITGGANVYPAEVEGVISHHPFVRDVAVFGIPDPEVGQQVKAAVEFERGLHVPEAELIAWCRERLAGFKCPKSVDVHDRLPREAHGKLKKRLLRDAYWP